MNDLSDYERGYQQAIQSRDGNAATSAEAKQAGGPDFMAGEDTDESPEWHRGYDDATVSLRDF